MRIFAFLLLVMAATTPAAARPRISLDPFAGTLDFTPERPRAVGSDHPLYRRVVFEGVSAMPARVGPALTPVSNAGEFNSAVRDALAGAHLLAVSPGEARVRLRVTWRRFDLPFRIGFSSRATVAVNYELSRIDNGQVIFSREIVTEAQARGGNAATRARETGRAAITTNLASATLCLDRAAVQGAPVNCALRPIGQFSAPIVVPVPVFPR